MQPLDLNLASNPFRNNTLLWVGYGAATVLLLGFTFWNVTTFADHRARLRELRDTAGTFESQRLDLETRGKRALDGIKRFDIPALEIQSAKANEVIEWKAFSWTRLFNALEEVQPHQVRMSGVRPIFSVAGTEEERAQAEEAGMPVALEGVAHDLAAFTALEGAMQEDESFGRVEPDRLTRTDAGEIAFQMHAWYLFGDAKAVEAVETARAVEPADATTPELPEPEPAGGEDPGSGEVSAAATVEPGSPEVEETWTAGQPPGSGEVESATGNADGQPAAAGTPPAAAPRPARKGKGRPAR